jgi:hypothetical protein
MALEHTFASKWPQLALGDSATKFDDVVQCLIEHSTELCIGDPEDADDFFKLPQGINDWVAYRLHYFETTPGFARMIRESSNDDISSIRLLLSLLEDYYHRKKRVVAKGSDHTIAVYTDDPGFFAFSPPENESLRKAFFPTVESFELRLRIDWDTLMVVEPEWRPTRQYCG